MTSRLWAIGLISIALVPWTVLVTLGVIETYDGINNPKKTCWLWSTGAPLADSPIHTVALSFVVMLGWVWGFFYAIITATLIVFRKVSWKTAILGLGLGVAVATSPIWAFSWLDEKYEEVAQYTYFHSTPNICGNDTE